MTSTTTPPALSATQARTPRAPHVEPPAHAGYVPGARPCLCAPGRGRKCEYRGRRCGVVVATAGTDKRGTGRRARTADAERAQAAQSQADHERSERDERERDEARRRNGGGRHYGRANTARNLETCGLLLGAEIVKGSASADHAASFKTRYVVSTLLIPKQHATSDM
ncbi:hypothetical protein DFH09DRAFT_1212817, partial [Mycena vulgaris]